MIQKNTRIFFQIRVFFLITFCEKMSRLSFEAVCFVCRFPNVGAACSGHCFLPNVGVACSGHRFLLSVEAVCSGHRFPDSGAVCSEHHLSDAEAVCSVCRVPVEGAASALVCSAALVCKAVLADNIAAY